MKEYGELLKACEGIIGASTKLAEDLEIDASEPIWVFIVDCSDAIAKVKKKKVKKCAFDEKRECHSENGCIARTGVERGLSVYAYCCRGKFLL